MKTKLISLTWRGSASVDPRFSAAMLSWAIADVCARDTYEKLSVGIENGTLEAYNCDFELQFSHQLKHVVGMCRMASRRSCHGGRGREFSFIANGGGMAVNGKKSTDDTLMTIIGQQNGIVYLLKDPRDPLLHIHLYESDAIDEMTELLHHMRDPSQGIGGSVNNIPSSFIETPGDASLQTALRGSGPHSTPASNLKMSEGVRNADHDGSPSVVSSTSTKLSTSKSYTSGFTGTTSAGTVKATPTTHGSASGHQPFDISPNNSQFFEVMYVGKIKVSHKRVPLTFIDDALPKFKAYDAQKIKMQADAARQQNNKINNSNDELDNQSRRSSLNSEKDADTTSAQPNRNSSPTSRSNELKIEEDHDKVVAAGATDDADGQKDEEEFKEKIINTRLSEENKENNLPPNRKVLLRGQSQVALPVKFDQTTSLPLPPPSSSSSSTSQQPQLQPEMAERTPDNPPMLRQRAASIGSIPLVEQNRTMVFLVGKTDMRLISPDRKQVLLYKNFKDVASCAQGHTNADHFGIICREQSNDGYIGYVFKCQSDSVADDIVASISQAFHSCSAEQTIKDRNQIFSCDHCPMLWYHKLCSDIEGLGDKKTQTTIFRRIEMLSDEEQQVVMAKYYGAEDMADHNIVQQNQFLMMLLRAHCESRQQRHVHDTAENRSEFLNQYLGGSTIFMKAKRSLTSSFDHLLKRRNSKDDIGAAVREIHAREIAEQQQQQAPKKLDSDKPENLRPRAASFDAYSSNRLPTEQLKSPMMDIFMKVGNSPKESHNHAGSWRQEILNRVVTPSKNHKDADFMSPYRGPALSTIAAAQPADKRSTSDLRQLWRTAIKQTILLARMERENARLQERHNEHELKKIKLDYDEIVPCDKQAIERWETFIDKDKELRISNKRDPKVLLQAIKTGVPRSKRGDIWLYLSEQFSMNTAPVDIKKFPNFNTPYKVLLKNLTEHQHAIFIDLGRTFPNHTYYKAALGIGQLSLFNILKAYSILDPELGYCQGLGFICGVLLLHCDEEGAFNLLKHLMFRRQMRTKYLPDMKQFQLQLYQLSRLIKDHMPDLYEWLDQNDVSPTLYAAPWILTVFSSQFPLGFVTRVFDLLFLESPEVIFKVAIALLEIHKDEIMKRDNFEEIMDYLKNVLPKIDAIVLETLMKDIFCMDIRKQLSEYHVEYNVLQEEISTTNHHLETLNREKLNNHHLETQLQFAQSSIAQLEKTRTAQQTEIQTLQSQIQSLQVTVNTLGTFMTQLVDTNHNIDMPGDIRRMVQQISQNIATANRKKPIFVERRIGKSISVNAQLGFPLKVLEELNESPDGGASPKVSKSSFFENSYAQIRQQNKVRPNRLVDSVAATIDMKLPEHVEKAIESMAHGKQEQSTQPPPLTDSGISTPISPRNMGLMMPPVLVSSTVPDQPIVVDPVEQPNTTQFSEMHPLSSCGDVNFKFNGTTQLKSLRPLHHHGRPVANSQHTAGTDATKNRRS